MSTWAVGDVQGCFDTFERLLATIDWRPGRDQLWLVGDLVNRGAKSLEVLRWARAHDERVVAVLGNHDLHLLARAEGARKPSANDTLDAVLDAPDRKKLLKWLRRRPFLHRAHGHVLVHAGIPPMWGLRKAQRRAEQAAAFLRQEGAGPLLTPRGPAPAKLRDAVAGLTRMRLVNEAGEPVFDYTGPPDSAPPGQQPWYAHPRSLLLPDTVVFGHWAALGHHRFPKALALDSGAVWGRQLTAIRLEDGVSVKQPSAEG